MTTTTPTPGENERVVPVMVEPAFNIEVPTTNPGGIEREVFGKWTVLLRNVTGAIAVITTCIAALMNAWSVNHSVTAGSGWPDMTIMLIMNVGPVIVAWTWINANKTLSTLLEGTSLTTKIRGKMAEIIAPTDYHPGANSNIDRRPLPETTPQPPPPAPAGYGRLDYPQQDGGPEQAPVRP